MEFVKTYERWISWIIKLSPAPDKFVHTYAGLVLWLAAAILLRKPLRSAVPCLAVLSFEVANECVDRVAHGSWMWPDTLGDVTATMFWPIVITLSVAAVPHLRR